MNYKLLNGMMITGPLTVKEKLAIIEYVTAYYDALFHVNPRSENTLECAMDTRTILRIPGVA